LPGLEDQSPDYLHGLREPSIVQREGPATRDPRRILRYALINASDNVGLGVRGKPLEAVQVGADFSYSNIRDTFDQQTLVGAPVATIPDVNTKLTRLNVFGKYAIDKASGVRFDYIYDRYSADDWLWSTWTYTDGTTLSDKQKQTVNFFTASYYFKW
jgi:hypothetical protein